MDTVKSFKGYGKVDELEQQAFRQKTRRRLIIISISVVLLIALLIGAVVGIVLHKRNSSSSSTTTSPPPTELTPPASLKTLCSVTQYPSSCQSSLQNSNTTDPVFLFKLSLRVATDSLSKLSDYTSNFNSNTGDPKVKAAIKICQSVFEDAIDTLNDTISSMEVDRHSEKFLSPSRIEDLKTWLSTTITDQETCLDALRDLNQTTVLQELQTAMANSTEFTSNSLAIVTKILGLLADFNIPIHRKLMGLPEWVSSGDRKLLQENNVTAHVTVSKDGKGDYTTIKDAVAAVPKKSKERFIIHVKEGIYEENVILDKSKWNVMMYGDGRTKTIVSGHLNFIDGTPTFSTATFAVAGKGFIGKDMGFINTAGPAKHQAVAFRSGSDLSVMSGCSFDGYQDTLYAHSNRQFYRDCDITGTIDFIFGNAAVVFQNCNIRPRQPLPNQFNTITAQGKKDINQNSGISIQKCTFSAYNNSLSAPTYLGRPWKEFSTTVIMQSEIGGFLNPVGWKEWVSGQDPPSSIFYGEYQNSGPGSNVDKRVRWAGYKPSLTDSEAGKFTVGTFLNGEDWLPATNVNFDTTL
ncbi:pectinesterase 3 [Cucumis melo var. makuwa]|uniref:Pectinesterase n=1 Tax=Cucumis melo var. makuwa TaxID=1194695 RepID=A0A5A7UGG5_CUCMM|nr:pectinesterase 3 [Cucumis melo var. makuwa]TYK19167.1 pectinesterase 3 [Cucumis melo var. makuwa]